jgi:hypothetical protein
MTNHEELASFANGGDTASVDAWANKDHMERKHFTSALTRLDDQNRGIIVIMSVV